MIKLENHEERNQLSDSLGAELGEILYLVEQELISLCYEWDLYKTLFGTSKERVEILNNALKGVAAVMENAIYDSILGCVARLTDKSRTGIHRNVSINSLCETCKKEGYLSDADQKSLDELVAKTNESVEGLRFVRDKMISHTDLDEARADFENVSLLSRKDIGKIIDSIQEVCNIIRTSMGAANYYTPIRNNGHDKRLFFILEKGTECFKNADIAEYARWSI